MNRSSNHSHTDQSVATGLALDARDSVFREEPHVRLDALRAREPVHHDRERDRILLTRGQDVAEALADRTLSADPFQARAAAAASRGVRAATRDKRTMVHLDDPDHARLRGLVTKAFSARAIEAMRPRVETIADVLLGDIDPMHEFDLIDAFAVPLPVLVIAAMLGIADVELDQFRRHLAETAALLAPAANEDERRRFDDAQQGIHDCFARMITERRATPRDDLVGALVAAEQDGDKLTEAEILNTCRLLLVAGNITTSELIGNGAVALLRHPEQLARLRSEPDLWPAAIEEILRYDSPVTQQHRQALDDRIIDGCPIEAGQTITAMLSAANHDPAVHADPHGFDIGRQHQRHYSFGGGAHFCLGASLARLEGQVALQALFDRFPELELKADRSLRRKALPGFSGYEAVWLSPAPNA